MANLDLEINENPAVIYGGFWRRVAAMLLDFLVLLVLIAPATFAQFYASKYVLPMTIIYNIIAMAYYVYFIGKWGATYGKKWMSLKVVDVSGNAVTMRQAFWRYLPWFLASLPALINMFFQYTSIPYEQLDAMDFMEKSVLLEEYSVFPLWFGMTVSLFWIGEIISLLVSKKKQSLHDRFAKTVVVIKN